MGLGECGEAVEKAQVVDPTPHGPVMLQVKRTGEGEGKGEVKG